MKKIFFFVALFAVMAMTTQMCYAQPTGIHITIFGQLDEAIISGGNTPNCWTINTGTISGPNATGGQGNYTYKWQIRYNSGTWSIILNATALSYSPGILTAGTYEYRRIVNDGCGSDTSNIISLTQYDQLLVGTTTGGNTSICYGQNGGTLNSPAATGGAPGTTYQWQQSIDGGIIWTDIIGQTTFTYPIGPLFDTTSFRIAVFNTCDTIFGNIKTINVSPLFIEGMATLLGSDSICPNIDPGIITATPATGGVTGTTNYQWQKSTDYGTTWVNILGATLQNYDIGLLNLDSWFRRMSKNTCDTLYTNEIQIEVYNVFAAGTITLVGNDTVCNGIDPGSFVGTTAIGGAPGTTYQWQKSIDGGIFWNNIPSETLVNYDIPALTTTTIFRRQDVNSCGMLYTNTITIYTLPVFNPGTIGVSQTICHGATPMQLMNIVAPSGGSGAYTYQWQESTDGGVLDPWTNIIGETNATFQPPSLTSGIWYHRIVTDTGGCGNAPSLP